MLVLGLLLLTGFPAISVRGGVQQQPTARIASIPEMSPARKPVSCGDIEDLPAGLVEGYKRHQAATYHAFTAEEVGTIRVGLLSWYDKNRRMLPWRGDPPPWTRTTAAASSSSSASGPSAASLARKEKDAAQPRLTAFFGSKPKQQQQQPRQQQPAAGAAAGGRRASTDGARGGGGSSSSSNSSSSNSSSSNSNNSSIARKRKKAEEVDGAEGNDMVSGDQNDDNDEVQGGTRLRQAGEEQQAQQRIPMTAYGTWVSEVMLQQTRVETVVDYYVKWMALFPTPKALAEADLEQVNKAWAGLGYYRRAKMLHLGAKKVLADYRGSLPATARELKELPGIGPYTAGAVASIAFGEREPLVDGNVIRVLSRLKAIASDPKNAGLNKLCWDLAGSIVDPARPGDFNQALMELGATVCTAKSPDCSACPVKASCLAYKLTAAAAGSSGGTKGPKPEAAPTEGSATTGGGEAPRTSPAPPPSSFPSTTTTTTTTTIFSSPGRPPPAASSRVSRRDAKCGCAVCEVGDDGMAAVPAAVTDFPRKAAKTLVKEQVLSVSVVERAGPEKGVPQILLVKRPETGLLAGQWECPCVVLRAGSESACAEEDAAANGVRRPKKKAPLSSEASVPEKERVRAADALLFSELGLSKTLVRSRAGVGSATHVFSHLRHTMQVERVTLAGDPDSDDNARRSSSREVRWVDASDMGGCGITTGMKKVLALATKARSGGWGPSAAKRGGGGTKARAGKAEKRKHKKDVAAEGAEKAGEDGSKRVKATRTARTV